MHYNPKGNSTIILITLFILIISITNTNAAKKETRINKNISEISDISIHFRFNKDVFERDYMNNAMAIDQFKYIFEDTKVCMQIDSITISAYASPEGDNTYNNDLAMRRAEGIKRYILLHYPQLNASMIHTKSQGENWIGLIDLMNAQPEFPSKNEVITILLGIGNSQMKETKIRNLSNGSIWAHLEQSILPQLRTGATCIVHYTQQHMNTLHAIQANSIQQIDPVLPTLIDFTPIQPLFSSKSPKPMFAIKTNILFDLATAINLEIEIPIREKFSVGAEWMFPWWIFDHNKYYTQLLMGTIEGRYWFQRTNKQEVLSGHALGLYISGGYYDFQWKKKGYQGEIVPSVGISYTYAHKVGKNFRLEYSLGLGVLNTTYRKYTANDGYTEFPWLSSRRTCWVGPTKAEVSFSWLISKRARYGNK